jgi:hypothetical protein
VNKLVFCILGVLAGCVPSPWQTTPPQLIAVVVTADTNELALEFDKPVAEAVVGGDVAPGKPRVDGPHVKSSLANGLKPGGRYAWSAEVKDAGGNQTTVAGRFYGPNDHPAHLRLNEVRVAGSGDHTDFIELRVDEAGSLGGWTLDAYSTPDAWQRVVLPDVPVAAGELIVVRYRDGASDTRGAREFRQPEPKGLPATKGLLALRPSPAENPSDALLYCKTPGEAAALADVAGWPGRDELNPEYCTATRTWNRTADGAWVLAANGGATPGEPNGSTVWGGPSPKKTAKPKTRRTRPRSGRGRRYGLDTTPKQVPAATYDARPRSTGAPREARSGTSRLSCRRTRPRVRVALPAKPRMQ